MCIRDRHDAEHALRVRGDPAPDILGDIESRRTFARYVADRFSLSMAGEPVELLLLGSEIVGGNLIIYQEGPVLPRGVELEVQSQILTDIWALQLNRVNIGSGDELRTLVFRGGDPAGRIELR